jgi:hypothetical protein
MKIGGRRVPVTEMKTSLVHMSSVQYVSALSLWALVSGHWSAWQAARVEVTQKEEADRRDAEPIEDKIVEKIVAETDVTAQRRT